MHFISSVEQTKALQGHLCRDYDASSAEDDIFSLKVINYENKKVMVGMLFDDLQKNSDLLTVNFTLIDKHKVKLNWEIKGNNTTFLTNKNLK